MNFSTSTCSIAWRTRPGAGGIFLLIAAAVERISLSTSSLTVVSEPHIQCTLRLRLIFDKLWELDKPRKKYSKSADYSNFDAALRDLELDVDTSWNLQPVLWTAGREEFAQSLARPSTPAWLPLKGWIAPRRSSLPPGLAQTSHTACTMRLKYITGDLDGALDMLRTCTASSSGPRDSNICSVSTKCRYLKLWPKSPNEQTAVARRPAS